ncbi:MAG: hypothetical protein HOH43_14545 [Candidatus Latescibacteria bacterium]|nr:hypothetical protein [Candidatus Latescibacterota bacterium]
MKIPQSRYHFPYPDMMVHFHEGWSGDQAIVERKTDAETSDIRPGFLGSSGLQVASLVTSDGPEYHLDYQSTI